MIWCIHAEVLGCSHRSDSELLSRRGWETKHRSDESRESKSDGGDLHVGSEWSVGATMVEHLESRRHLYKTCKAII